MSEWVGLQPLRVQALMTKLQAEKSKLANLESRVLSIQNSLSWEITSQNDVADALQRARNKIRRRGELLTELEGALRNAVDSFDATDRKRSDSQNALSYWSVAAAGGALVTGLGSLGMSCGDRLFDKFGSLFGTGTGGALVSGLGTVTRTLPIETVLGTPAPAEDKSFFEGIAGVTKSVGTKLDNSVGWIGDNVQLTEEEAHQRGLNGEKPDNKLFITNMKAYNAQLKAWKSTLSEEELAAYEAERAARAAEREAEREANKPWYKKAYDKLRDANEGVTKAAKNFKEDAEEKLDAAGKWVDEKVEAGVEWVDEKVEAGVEWVGDKAEDVGEWASEKIEDGKQWVNDVTGEVNDYLEEHPPVKYGVAIVGDVVDFTGSTLSFLGKAVKGDLAGAGAALYNGAVNDFVTLASDCSALGNYGIGRLYDTLTDKGYDLSDYAQEAYAQAEGYYNVEGLAGILEYSGYTNAADVVEMVDDSVKVYSAVTGGASMLEKMAGGKMAEAIFNWKNLQSGETIKEMTKFYDDLVSNVTIIKDVGEGILEKDGSGIISTIISPAKIWGKFDSVFGQYSE